MKRQELLSEAQVHYPHLTTRIYAIQCLAYLKVGIADDLERRIAQIEALNPSPVAVMLYRTIPRHRRLLIERDVHQRLAPWHHRREWFTAPLEEVRAAVSLAILEAKKLDRLDRERVEKCRSLTAPTGLPSGKNWTHDFSPI